MYVDSHCHLDFPELAAEMPAVLEAMAAARVSHALCISVNLPDWPRVHGLAMAHPNLYATVGVHPDGEDTTEATVETLVALAGEPKVVAIGETGLDAHWPDNAPAEVQEEFLRRHIALSKRVGKPLVLHHRNAGERVAEILEAEGPPPAGGTFHCFAGDLALARRVVAMGFRIGVGGSATFKKSPLPPMLRELGVRDVILETDSPYLAPMPHRGTRNEPMYLALVRDQVAASLGMTPEAFEEATDASSRALFKI